MEHRLELEILPQPDDYTCGPTCLHAVYRYFDDEIPLPQLIEEVPKFVDGGTIEVLLGCHALERGYDVKIHTYNLTMFDPTWFDRPGVDLADKLRSQAEAKDDPKLRQATPAYLRFLELGGRIVFDELRRDLLRGILKKGTPILTGLSSTYLYRCAREFGPHDVADDVRGTSSGHFVVLAGYDKRRRTVLVADPYGDNPEAEHYYDAPIDRVVGAILLGVLHNDASLLLLKPRGKRAAPARG